jgi:hypothetical protein
MMPPNDPDHSPPKTKRERKAKPVDSGSAGKITVKTETTHSAGESAREVTARIKREDLDHRYQVYGRFAVVIGAICVVTTMVIASLVIMVNSVDTQLKAWATASISSAATAFIGYLAGKQSPK